MTNLPFPPLQAVFVIGSVVDDHLSDSSAMERHAEDGFGHALDLLLDGLCTLLSAVVKVDAGYMPPFSPVLDNTRHDLTLLHTNTLLSSTSRSSSL